MPRYSILVNVFQQFFANRDQSHQGIKTNVETCQTTQRPWRECSAPEHQAGELPIYLLVPAENRASLICFVKDEIWAVNNTGLPKTVNAFYPRGKGTAGIAALAPVLPMFLQSCHFLAMRGFLCQLFGQRRQKVYYHEWNISHPQL